MRSTLPLIHHRAAFRTSSVYEELCNAVTRNNPLQITNLVWQANNDESQLPSEDEIAELLRQAVQGKTLDGVKAGLTGLTGFDANAKVQGGRTLLSIAVEANDFFFSLHLLRLGANSENIETNATTRTDVASLLRTAQTVHNLDLKSGGPNKGLSPIEYALVNYDLDRARTFLEQQTRLPLNASNVRKMWRHAVNNKRSDLACAVLALSQKEWIDDLYKQKEADKRSTLHLGLPLPHAGLKNVLKKYPYYPPKLPFVQNANRKANFANTKIKIVCGTISPFIGGKLLQVHKHRAAWHEKHQRPVGGHTSARWDEFKETEKEIFDPSMLEEESLPKHIPLGTQYAHEKLRAAATELHVVPHSLWRGAILSGIFNALDQEKPWTDGIRERRIKLMGIGSFNHSLAALFIIKRDANGKKWCVILPIDANSSYAYKRARGTIKDIDEWSLASWLPNGEASATHYRMDANGMAFVFAYPEGAWEALMAGKSIDPLPTADRRVTSMPDGNGKFTPDFIAMLLTAGFVGSWRDMQIELRHHVSSLSDDQAGALLGKRNDRGWALFSSLVKHKERSFAAVAYLEELEELPISANLKLQLLSEQNNDGDTALHYADAEMSTKILDFYDKLLVADQEKFRAVNLKNKKGISPIAESIGDLKKLRAILDFNSRLNIPDELKFECVDLLNKDGFPFLADASAEVVEAVCGFVARLNVPDEKKLDIVLRNGNGIVDHFDGPAKVEAVCNLVKGLKIAPEKKIMVLLAHGGEDSDPVLTITPTDTTIVFLELANDLRQEGLDISHLANLMLSLPPTERAPSSDVCNPLYFSYLSEGSNYDGKIRALINFTGSLGSSVEKTTEIIDGQTDNYDDRSPLGSFLFEGKTERVVEFLEALIGITISTREEEDIHLKAEIALAFFDDGSEDIPGAILALRNGHYETASKWYEILRRSPLKDHLQMAAALGQIEQELLNVARGIKRRRTSSSHQSP